MTSSRKNIIPSSDENRGYVEPSIIRGAFNNDVGEVAAALNLDPATIYEVDEGTGGTALHVAAYRGNVEVASHLISQPGVDLWSQDKLGRDVLDVAIAGGHPELCRLLLRFSFAASEVDPEVSVPKDNERGANVVTLHPTPRKP